MRCHVADRVAMAWIATQEIRERAIAAYDAGQGSQQEVAAMFGIHLRIFQRWLKRYRSGGLCRPLQRGHRRAGQSLSPQGQRSPLVNRRGRCRSVISATL
ncbi:MAG: hypothetical protein DRP83_03650 [Planctomycetota bacterium]|nr:MAG: hypothetical protein DRP83_03650 [Planctomycetota bacterium]